MISFPFALRFLFASRPEALARAMEVIYRLLATYLAPTRRKNAKATRLGEQAITAEVLKEPDADGWVRLLVRRCEILSEYSTKKLSPISTGREIKRAKRTILLGKPERLLGSDETARAVVAGRIPGA